MRHSISHPPIMLCFAKRPKPDPERNIGMLQCGQQKLAFVATKKSRMTSNHDLLTLVATGVDAFKVCILCHGHPRALEACPPAPLSPSSERRAASGTSETA